MSGFLSTPALNLLYLVLVLSVGGVSSLTSDGRLGPRTSTNKNAPVLILGGGVTGVIAARTLHERGFTNFRIVEAREELGGRMQTWTFGGNFTVEQGPNWVQGTQTGDGSANPILSLTQKHNVKTQFYDIFGSLSE